MHDNALKNVIFQHIFIVDIFHTNITMFLCLLFFKILYKFTIKKIKYIVKYNLLYFKYKHSTSQNNKQITLLILYYYMH